MPARLSDAELAQQRVRAMVQDQFQSLDIVWARMSGFPWWPAMFFNSWEAVARAGIGLPPSFEKIPVIDTKRPPSQRDNGVEPDEPEAICVVMFLDSFNFARLPVSTRTIRMYTTHYAKFAKAKLGNSNRRGQLKCAMKRAEELLHLDDRAFVDEPTPERVPIDTIDLKAPVKKPKSSRGKPPRKQAKRLSMDPTEPEVVEILDDPEEEASAGDSSYEDEETTKRSKGFKRSTKRVQRGKNAQTSRTKGKGMKRQHGNTAPLKTEANEVKKSNGTRKQARRVQATGTVESGDSDAREKKRVKAENSPAGESPTQQVEDTSSLPMLAAFWTNMTQKEHNEEQNPPVVTQELVWDDSVFMDGQEPLADSSSAALSIDEGNGRGNSKRSGRSMQQSQIRQNLMMGNLDPHTMVQCEVYRLSSQEAPTAGRGGRNGAIAAPFQVVVHPEAVFLCDLHAHLATCEIIGFLGGRWDESSRILYIQAAFPCRSLVIDGDDGATDVEMDPQSEIELREIIEKANLEVVGWYHSHPAFAPDPSIRDIENQASYQQLFQRPSFATPSRIFEPFVGLIVGTYDTKRDTAVSLFRYFNVRSEKVNGGARREIFMPFEFTPTNRRYRSVVQEEEQLALQRRPMYPSVLSTLVSSSTVSLPKWKAVALPVDIAVPTKTEPQESTHGQGVSTKRGKPPRKRSIASEKDGQLSKKPKRARGRPVSKNKQTRKPGGRKGRPRGSKSTRSSNCADEAAVKEESVSLEDITHECREVLDGMIATLCDGDKTDQTPEIISVCSSDDGGGESDGDQDAKATTDNEPIELDFEESSADEVEITLVDETSSINKSVEMISATRHSQANEDQGDSQETLQSVPSLDINTRSDREADRKAPSAVMPSDGGATVTADVKREEIERQMDKKLHDSIDTSKRRKSRRLSIQTSDFDGTRSPSSAVTITNPTPELLELASSMSPTDGTPRPSTPSDCGSASGRRRTRKPIQTIKKKPSYDCRAVIANQSPKGVQSIFQSNGPIMHGITEPIPEKLIQDVRDASEAENPREKIQMVVYDEKVAKGSAPPTVADIRDRDIAKRLKQHRELCACNKLTFRSSLDLLADLFERLRDEESKRQLSAKTVAVDNVDQMNPVRTPQGFATHNIKDDQPNPKPLNASAPEKVMKKEKRDIEKHKTLDNSNEAPKDEDHTRRLVHLKSMRTKYGDGIRACVEQVITLVDYYSEFERRIDIYEPWKSRIRKLDKIEVSLSANARNLNLSANLREHFIEDIMCYLRLTWAAQTHQS